MSAGTESAKRSALTTVGAGRDASGSCAIAPRPCEIMPGEGVGAGAGAGLGLGLGLGLEMGLGIGLGLGLELL